MSEGKEKDKQENRQPHTYCTHLVHQALLPHYCEEECLRLLLNPSKTRPAKAEANADTPTGQLHGLFSLPPTFENKGKCTENYQT